MPSAIQAMLTDWDVPPVVTILLFVTACIYLRGWIRLRRFSPGRLERWRCVCFLGGITSLFLAVASPLDTYSEALLSMHMAQHFVLMSVAPPLIVLGAPVVPLLRGLLRSVVRYGLSPIFRSSAVHRIKQFLLKPVTAWVLMNATYVAWHIPAAYEFALKTEAWHEFEHLCFFVSSLLFWWLVIRPWPSRIQFSEWIVVPYLLLSDLVNTGLSALLCFSGRLMYPSYAEIERPFQVSAQTDQVAAGAFMWVFGSIVFVVPAVVTISRLLSGRSHEMRGLNSVGARSRG